MRVLLTRPRADSEAIAAELARHGHSPIISPMLEIHPTAIELNLEDVGAIAMTSANAVTALADLEGAGEKPVFAVGSRTAEAIQHAGLRLAGVASGSVESLADAIAASWAPEKGVILHLSGQDIRGDLVGDLKTRGFRARRQVVYEARRVEELTAEAHEAIQRGEVDAVMFFSYRTADHFTTLVAQEGLRPCLTRAYAICLSPTVAEALRQSDWNHIVVAPHSELSAMIETMDDQRDRAGNKR